MPRPALYAADLHRVAGGHVVSRSGVVPALRGRDARTTLVVGMEARVQGPVVHAGAVAVAAGACVVGALTGGHEVVVGARARVAGGVKAAGRVVVQDGAVVAGDVEAGGDVLLLGSCRVGAVHAGGDIVVVGSPATGELHPGGRVSTRPW